MTMKSLKSLFKNRFGERMMPEGLQQFRWNFDVYKRGCELYQEYRYIKEPKTTPWHHAAQYYAVTLKKKQWRWKDLGYREEYYDGYHCAMCLPFVTFAWFSMRSLMGNEID